jgi:hypothetical protein
MTTGRGAEATDAFLRAIDLEIEAILMGSATDVIPLRQGTRTLRTGTTSSTSSRLGRSRTSLDGP